MFDRDNIEAFLKTEIVLNIENEIAKRIESDIYRENLPLLAGFVEEEIKASDMDFKGLKRFVTENQLEITEFGFNFLNGSKINSLSSGIVITYTIYLIYLKEKEESELLKYLKRRRMLNPQNILKKLLIVKDKMIKRDD